MGFPPAGAFFGRGFKDATVLILDVGRAMQVPVASGEKATKAEVALSVGRSFLQQKLLFTPKHEVGLVLFGTMQTRNALQEQFRDDSYQSVVAGRDSKIDVPDVEALRFLFNPPAGGAESDAVNGIIVAIDLMVKRTRDLKYNKILHLVTDSSSVADGDPAGDPDLLECIQQIEAQSMRLRITLVGGDPLGSWSKLAEMSSQVSVIPLATFVHQSTLSVKPVEQRAKQRLRLVISPDMEIPVGVFGKTITVRPPTLKKRSKLSTAAQEEKKDAVVIDRLYHLADDPDGEEVKKEDRIKGHKYGGSIVPMSEYDEAALMYACERALVALGFAPADSVTPEHSIRQVDAVAADPGNRWAFVALESLVDAMLAARRVLIARFVARTNSQPRMVALFPEKGSGENASYLTMQYMPFTEDIREWTCASLPIPSAEQRDAVTALIDDMNLDALSGPGGGLASLGTETAGKSEECFRPEDMHNPALRRFYNFLARRAMDPAAKVPPPGPEQLSIFEQPPQVVERLRASKTGERLKAAFGFKRVEGKASKTKRFWREIIAEKRKDGGSFLEEVDTKRIKVDGPVKKSEKEEKEEDEDKVKQEGVQGAPAAEGMALPVGVEPPPRVHVSTMHPVKDFEKWLAHRVGGVDTVGPAIEQMCSVIDRLAEEGEEFHGKALSCLTSLRAGCVRESEARRFNDFIRRLSREPSKRKAKFWERARAGALGLVTDEEVATSTVCQAEAHAFLAGEDYVARSAPGQSPSGGSGGGSGSGAGGGISAAGGGDLEAMLE